MSGGGGGTGTALTVLGGAALIAATGGLGAGLVAPALAGAGALGGAAAIAKGVSSTASAAKKELSKVTDRLTGAKKPETIAPPRTEDLKKAKLSKLVSLQQRSGRASTLLTDVTGNKFGG